MSEFEGVVPALGQALAKRGYAALTSVQRAIIDPDLTGADLLVSAQTGSGKTVAFGLALETSLLGGAERFDPAGTPLALAVAPTRELALQVKRELDWLYEMTGANIASCVGGMDMRNERRALERGAHIVVGTPGRLRDHIERGSLDMSGLRAVVLDEADEMLDLGFREDLEYILDAAPAERRTLMFSATVPRGIAALAKRYQRDAVRVTTAEEKTQHMDIEYRALTVAPNDRENAVINILRYYEAKTALVFCATRMAVNHMTTRFTNRGFSVVALSGELSQNERTHALQAMRDGRARVCIATDVAARGIDLPDLELVVHADIPKTSETLVHRSGRTGRAGRKGVCAIIVPHNARRKTERLLRDAHIQAEWAPSPSIEDVVARDRERLFEDPALSDPITAEEDELVQEVMSRFKARDIAAAFVRLYQAGHPAPEELLDASAEEPSRKKRRDDFADGVWFRLSVGRKDHAEPRWLLPMLCRAGHITKNEIGAIRIQQNETFVELTPGCVDRFLAAVGPERTVEESVVLTRLDRAPDLRDDAPFVPASRPPFRSRSSSAPRRPEDRGAPRKPYRKFEHKADVAPEPAVQAEPERGAEPGDRDGGKPGKPWQKKKPFKKGKPGFKFAPNADGKPAKGKKTKPRTKPKFAGGDAPLKRKKPRKKFD